MLSLWHTHGSALELISGHSELDRKKKYPQERIGGRRAFLGLFVGPFFRVFGGSATQVVRLFQGCMLTKVNR